MSNPRQHRPGKGSLSYPRSQRPKLAGNPAEPASAEGTSSGTSTPSETTATTEQHDHHVCVAHTSRSGIGSRCRVAPDAVVVIRNQEFHTYREVVPWYEDPDHYQSSAGTQVDRSSIVEDRRAESDFTMSLAIQVP